MRTRKHVRNWTAKASVAVIFSSIGLALMLAALIYAFAIQPPVLGWVGFAIVSITVLGLGVLATLAFQRTRVSPQRPADAVDREQRLLVVADSRCSEIALCNEIVARLDRAVAVHLVVPIRVSRLHFLTDDESEERHDAEESMSISVGLLQQLGVPTTGSVGSDKPLESMTDALGSFPATQVLLATPPEEESYWLERGLLAKARALTKTKITQAIVPSTPSSEPTARNVVPVGSCAQQRAHAHPDDQSLRQR